MLDTMLEDQYSEKIALYFYFLYLDESKAQAATLEALKSARKVHNTKRQDGRALTAESFVRITNQISQKSTKKIKPTALAFTTGQIVLPEKSNWGPWFEFRKTAQERDFQAVLYSSILKIADKEIAKGLDLPLGTVRYRIGHGLKLLGGIVSPERGKHATE